MSQFTEFAINNWHLFAGLIVISGLLLWPLVGGRLKGYGSADPQQTVGLINNDNALVLDIRSDKDYSQNHILNALHVPRDQIKDQMDKLEAHRDKSVIVCCNSGSQSMQVCATLSKAGFDSVYNLHGGILAWQNAGLPTTKR